MKKVFFRNFAKFIRKHVFSCDFCVISKNTFSYRILSVDAYSGCFFFFSDVFCLNFLVSITTITSFIKSRYNKNLCLFHMMKA